MWIYSYKSLKNKKIMVKQKIKAILFARFKLTHFIFYWELLPAVLEILQLSEMTLIYSSNINIVVFFQVWVLTPFQLKSPGKN